MNIFFFKDYIKYRPFWKKVKEAPLENLLIFMCNDFQQLCCKILSENQPVNEFVNANEHFLSKVSTTCRMESDIKSIAVAIVVRRELLSIILNNKTSDVVYYLPPMKY